VAPATHVFWDAFTHPGRWGPVHIEWLRTEHSGLLGLMWLQYVEEKKQRAARKAAKAAAKAAKG
jgi:hypothetical protein